MFGIGLSKKINRLDAYLYTLSEQRMRDLASVHSDINFIVQELSNLKLEIATLRKQLIKDKGRITLTIVDKEFK